MKTRKNTTLNAVASITLLATLLIMTACTDQKNSSQVGSSTANANVKPPQIDIHTAVITDNLEALQQHIAAGSNLNEKDPFGGSSPLISAAVFDKPKMAKVLIDAGADLNFQNNDGSTALHSAAFFCRPEIVKMLLDKGADKTIKNKFGGTAYESVVSPFSDVKNTYDMIGKMLEPMGLKLDYTYIEKTRPEIAAMLK
jgi:ankyrin repeat protein